MGSLITDASHSLVLLTADNAGQSPLAPEDFDIANGATLSVAGPPGPNTDPACSALPPNVRRAVELLDKLDAQAEAFRVCAETMARSLSEALRPNFTETDAARQSVVRRRCARAKRSPKV